MKVFVTGATGFIGSHFVNHALARGHEVVAHRRTSDSCPAVPLLNGVQWITNPLAQLQSEDISGCDAVVHLAATGVTPKPATWDGCLAFNACGSLALMQLANAAGIQRFVVSGTYAEYGKAGLRFDPIPADAPLEPTDPYAASKAAGGIAMAAYARVSGMQLYYGRVFSAYGEGQSESNFWPQLRKAARAEEDFPMTLGEQIRDFIPVAKVAEMFLDACVRDDIPAGVPMVCNVASGDPISLIDFAKLWWASWSAAGKLLPGAIPYRANEVMRYVPMVD